MRLTFQSNCHKVWLCDDALQGCTNLAQRFIKLARERVEKGWNLASVLGSNDVDLDDLLHSSSTAYNPMQEEFCVNSWAINILRVSVEPDPVSVAIGCANASTA